MGWERERRATPAHGIKPKGRTSQKINPKGSWFFPAWFARSAFLSGLRARGASPGAREGKAVEVRAGRRNIFPLVLSFFAAASQSPRPVLPARGKSSTRTSAAFFFIPLSFLSSLDGCVFLGAAVLSPRLWASPTLSRCCCCLVFPPLCPARFISSLAAANGGANKFFCFFFFLLGRMVVSSLTRARSLARFECRRGAGKCRALKTRTKGNEGTYIRTWEGTLIREKGRL